MSKKLFAAGLAIAVSGVACATIPPFQTSKPLEESKSLQEALVLCHEYRFPMEGFERPIALRPFLDCIDDASSLHPPNPLTSVFPTFRKEFHDYYDQLQDSLWSRRLAAELETAIHAVLRSLWQDRVGTGAYTEAERDYALKHFPKTAELLKAQDWRIAWDHGLDSQLEALVAAVASMSAPVSAASQTPVTPMPQDLCEKFVNFRTEVHYLQALWKDRQYIAKTNWAAGLGIALEKRYRARILVAEGMLADLRAETKDAGIKRGFQAVGCEQG